MYEWTSVLRSVLIPTQVQMRCTHTQAFCFREQQKDVTVALLQTVWSVDDWAAVVLWPSRRLACSVLLEPIPQ